LFGAGLDRVTMNMYGHLLAEMRKEAARQMDAVSM
jgi:hypothetical protein